ncbi:sigma-70 family RNA polymerase sigma factor [Achromobacter seleniivolatilans]|uniref:Sigma-70 family RNA polymerase sigma factor n=1 Tax=Achromobacter seleniivolatilans TaxID=3047478 RepID=A0ABY9M0X2_9BURK|nr:sigma-70 family RNA polymerase sigma factor [Achromobacter sp. R39]WMD20268.1 sigma-70 family RNA polymerase sigma factor [Achromobacter sp. R39]
MPNQASQAEFVSLYCDHHRWLQSWLHRRLGSAADAADLAHDAFLKLIQVPRRFGSAPEARSYLRSMANGMCVDLWRRRNIEQAWLETLAAQPEAVAPSAEHQAIVLEALSEIDTMLRTLPVKVARAFVMAVAGDMTHKEVARELNVSTRSVTTYVAQAMLHCLQLEARLAVADTPGGGWFPPHPGPRVAL